MGLALSRRLSEARMVARNRHDSRELGHGFHLRHRRHRDREGRPVAQRRIGLGWLTFHHHGHAPGTTNHRVDPGFIWNRLGSVQPGMDDDEREGIRTERFDPDNPAVLAAEKLVHLKLALQGLVSCRCGILTGTPQVAAHSTKRCPGRVSCVSSDAVGDPDDDPESRPPHHGSAPERVAK